MEDASLDQFVDDGSADGDSDVDETDASETEVDGSETEADGPDAEVDASGATDETPLETEPDESELDDPDSNEGETPADEPEAEATTSNEATPTDGPSPTMVYAPDGATCEGCGEVVQRRWRGEAGLRCGVCKPW